ncbi:molybdenum cofactor guanylyltransferase MobA [Sulfuricystis multivorans]|uniref:molybdenum cofactor guanylyltransferase MobA n=1 Tax=Sulfuricystis multivorans TaxID=2211108 RepID=UPI000F81D735|nr:molybdenum cofactor guanylyltransferase MobA [Sulfuricystis multivorans]
MDSAVTGLILAGGEGRRMGGADKGLLDYRGKPLIAHVIERFAPQVGRLLISANRNLDAYRAFGYPVVCDAAVERCGPLAGIAAGLSACTTPWLAVVPCDCPTLPVDLVPRLMAGIGPGSLAIAATSAGTQPTFLLCRRDLLPTVEARLACGERKLMAWCRDQGAVTVDFPDAAAFRNLNTPDELTSGT